MRKKVGRLVTFEGIDGSGKSTVTRMVYEKLREEGVDTVLTCEPTTTWLGEAVKRSYIEDVSPFTEAFLFLADRATHTNEISKWLGMGKIVLSDRYCDSTYAYQGVILKSYMRQPMNFLRKCSEKVVLLPDLTFLLLIPPELSLERITCRDNRTKFEKVRFLKQVEKNYLELSKKEKRFVKIDATLKLEKVVSAVMETIHEKLHT